MKKSALFIALLVYTMTAISQNNVAEVKKVMGFYVFIDNTPIQEYVVVGVIDNKNHNDSEIINSGAQYEPVRDYLIKKARETFYDADGIILNLVYGGVDKATVIKFKDETLPKLAKVDRKHGIFVFTDCEPVMEYKYLGTINGNAGKQYSPKRDKMIKRGQKKYESANGMIVKLVNGGRDTAEMILFE